MSGLGCGHDICRVSPKGIEYRVRVDGSIIINSPRIWDTPYAVRVLVEVSPEHLAAREWSGTQGELVDALWAEFGPNQSPPPSTAPTPPRQA